jgi:hypothetical protein
VLVFSGNAVSAHVQIRSCCVCLHAPPWMTHLQVPDASKRNKAKIRFAEPKEGQISGRRRRAAFPFTADPKRFVPIRPHVCRSKTRYFRRGRISFPVTLTRAGSSPVFHDLKGIPREPAARVSIWTNAGRPGSSPAFSDLKGIYMAQPECHFGILTSDRARAPA